MKELHNFIYKHMDSLKHHKRYLAMLTALSMLVTFIVPLILIEPADSMTGKLICNKVEHIHNDDCYIGGMLNCSVTEEHIHTEDCYKKFSLFNFKKAAQQLSEGQNSHVDNVTLSNAAGSDAHVFGEGENATVYSPNNVPLYVLLFGEGNSRNWVDPTKSLEENLEIANSEYFLGFASDFCAFIEGDFTATEADAEGRMFVGGDLSFKKNWNYQIGSGDFGNFTPMNDTEEYRGIYGYASAIVGGKLYRVGTLSTGHSDWVSRNPNSDRHKNDKTVFYTPEEGLYKSFIVGNVGDSLHYKSISPTESIDQAYKSDFSECMHDYPGDCTNCSHSYFKETNELAQLYQYNKISEILEKTFDTLRMRSASLGQIQAESVSQNGTLSLDLTNIGDVKTVYFKLESWSGLGNVEIIVPEDRVTIDKNQYTENADEDTITNLDLNIVINCMDEEINIGNTSLKIKVKKSDGTYVKVKNSDGTIKKLADGKEVDYFQISHFDGKLYTNNHPVSSNLLYNFPNASKVTINGNFNGTILAPNADAEAQVDPCPGHLSGALIAKSFYGGLEFGYRPYRGGNDIFGMTSGYEIPVDKFNETREYLPGAMFAVKDSEGNILSLFESTDKTNFVAIPSKVDFTGKTPYGPQTVNVQQNQEKKYSGSEFMNGSSEKLVAPVEIAAYSDFDCTNQIDSINVDENGNDERSVILTKFYIKSNQKVDLNSVNDNNSNIYYDSNVNPNENGEYIYIVELKQPVTSFDITATSKADGNTGKVISINFKPMKLNLTTEDNTFIVGTPINFEVENAPIGDNLVLIYEKLNQQNNWERITLNDSKYTPVPSDVRTDGNKLDIKVSAKIGGEYGTTIAEDNVQVEIGKYNLPTDMELLANNYHVNSNDLLRLSVTGSPVGATVKYYYKNDYSPEATIITDENGTNTYEIGNPDIIGDAIPVKAVVSLNGDEKTLINTVKGDFPENMQFSLSSYEYIFGDSQSINVKLENVPNGCTVEYKIKYSDDNNVTIYNGSYVSGNIEAQFTPVKVGTFPVTASVTLNGLTKTFTRDVTVGYKQGLNVQYDKTSCKVNEVITVTVSNAPNGYKVIAKLGDSISNDGTVSNYQACNVTVKPTNAGNYTLNVYVKYGENEEKLISSQNITVIEQEITASTQNQEQNTSICCSESQPLSLRRANLLSDILLNSNTDVNDNLITINAPSNERIDSVKLKINSKSDKFTLKAIFYSADGAVKGQQLYSSVTNENNTNYITIKQPDAIPDNIVKIELMQTEGFLEVSECVPTYAKECNYITKTYTDSFTLSKDDETILTLEEWAKSLDAITLNIKSNNQNINTYAKVKVTLLDANNQQIGSTYEAASSDVSKNVITIDGINADDVAKVKIQAVDTSASFSDFSISAYTATEVNEAGIPTNNEWEKTSTYTIEEQQAPVGFFKDDDLYYTIEVTESFKLDEVESYDGKTYPKMVKTKVVATPSNNGEPIEYNLEIYYGIMIDEETGENVINPQERIIRILDNTSIVIDEFRLSKRTDGASESFDKIEHKVNDNEYEVLEWSDTTPDKYQIDDDKEYYFNPNSMMVVPVPSKKLEFRNTAGLLFRKIDDKGAAVSGVQIDLYKNGVKVEDKTVWGWNNDSSEFLIKLDQLDMYENGNQITYKFVESYTGGKYEYAADIYFQKIDGKTIHYWTGTEEKPDEGGYTKLDLTQDRIIRMVNTRVTGIRPKLRKTSTENGIIITGSATNYAVFSLHANDGTELLNPVNVENGEVILDFDDYNSEDTTYIENKYLKEGTYYLQEHKAPSGFEASTKLFYFNVVKDSKDAYRVIPFDTTSGEYIDSIAWSTESCPDYTVEELTFYYADGTSKSNEGKKVEVFGEKYWYSFDFISLGIDPNNVVGIKLKVSGNVTEDKLKKFMIQNYNGKKIWGDKDEGYGSYTNIDSGVEYKIGAVPDENAQQTTEAESTDNTTTTMEAVPTIKVDNGDTIVISNKPLGTTMNLRVDKSWVGDEGITVFQKPVKIMLYQSTTEGEKGELFIATEKQPNEVELNSANNWSYVWEDLPRYVDATNTEGKKYYYTVEEVTDVTGYTKSAVTDSLNEGGTITVTNTLNDVVEIPVVKHWSVDETKYPNYEIPATAEFKLEAYIDNEWKAISEKTLILTSENEDSTIASCGITNCLKHWSGKFENLPKGYKYRVVEVKIPSNWKVNGGGTEIDSTGNIAPQAFTNTYEVATGSIAIQKLWDQVSGNKPYSVIVDLYRSVIAPSYTETDYTETDLTQNYKRLLQHSLYFYDANMCGDDVAASSAIAWRTNCHVNDEVQGGYHDAGDHVMFGLAQGFSASTLGWNFYEFNTTAEEGKKVYDISGQTEHYKMIMKRFCDFFVDATVYNGDNIQKVLMQKGKGNKGADTNHDHTYWGPPEDQPDLYVSGITRPMMWQENGSGTGGNVAAQYAASLALYSLNFPNDPDSANYLKVAKDLFKFANDNSTAFSIGNYADGSSAEEIAWAAVWLALATGNESDYISNSVKSTLTGGDIPGRGHYWENPLLGAKTVYACHIEPEGTTTIKDKVTSFLNSCSGDNYKIFDGWGSARHNTLNQLTALAMDKNFNTNYREWCAKQTGYLLGNNNIPSNGNDSTCFVTGYAPNSARNAHHRAASGYDADEYDNKGATACVDHYDEENGKTLIGALVGGPKDSNDNSGSYSDIMDGQMAWETNEVALDYNAGLVGAAAGLYYFNSGDNNELSNTIVGVEYGAYGLDQRNPDAASPTKSAVPEAESASVNKAVSEYVLNTFARRQTAVRINEDNIEDIANPYVPPTLEYKDYQIPTTIQNYISEIEVTFNGTYGTGALVIYGNNNNQTQHSYDISNSTSLSIKVTNPVTKFSLNKWNGGDQSIKEINVHWQLPLIITPENYFVEANTPFNVVPTNHTGEITWNFGNTGFIEDDTDNTRLIAPSEPGTYTITGTDQDKKTCTFDVEVIPSGSVVRDISLGTINKQGWNTWDIPDDLGSYGVNKVVFKFNKQVNVNWYTFKLMEDGTEVGEYNFNNIPESLYYGFPLTPTDSVSFGLWSNDVDALPEYMYLICSPPTLSITSEKDNVTEGDTIHLESKDKKENSTVNWTSPNGTGTGDTYDFTAGHVTQDTNVEITATDGTNTDKKTLTINPLAFTENSITIEGFNAERTLELNSTRPLTDFNWTSSDPTYITVENGIITAKKTTTDPITIMAADKNNSEINARISVSANVPVEDLTISGESTTGIGGEITLTKLGGPHEALSYKWTSSNPSIASVDQNGMVIGEAPGEVTITLEAYSGPDQTGTILDSVEKKITIQNIRVKKFITDQTINRANGTNKCEVSLKDIPSNAIIKRITANLSGNLSIEKGVHEMMLKEGTKYQSTPEAYNLSGTGSMSIDTSSFSENILCGSDDSYYSFQIWWAGTDSYITVTSIVIEYETDGRLLTMKYNDNSESKTIRNKQTANFTVTATGGTLGDVVLKNGETIIEGAITGDNGNYTVTPPAAGSYKITATMDDITKSIALTVKDNITVNGDYKMDFNSSQTLDVNNKIRTITWTPVGEINTDYTVDGNIVTFQNANKEIAVFNTSTGDVTVFEESGSFTVKATDSYDNTFTEFEISISERPKVPVLPKYDESFKKKVEVVLKDGEWIGIADKLPLTDEKGNPYYYYIQESGYRLTENGETSVMNDTIGHYIHSNGSVWMPINYYNNGLFPAQNGETVPIAKVENKLTETIQGQLPSTGGSGVKTYYYIGGAIMLLGIAGFTGIKRRERKRRKE